MNALQYAENVTEVFVFPDAYLRVKQLLESERADMDEVSEVIQLDPSLASKILKLANSAIYNLPKKIDTISKALVVLGAETIYNLVISSAVISVCEQVSHSAIDMDRFWEQSVHSALIARALGNKVAPRQSEQLYVSGLLHNIGELALCQLDPELAKACEQYSADEKPWQCQRRVLGFTYAELSAALLRLWQLPNSIIEPIALQHQPDKHLRQPAVLLLNISSRMALANVHPELYKQTNLLDPFVLEVLGIIQPDLRAALDFCNSEALYLLSVLNPKAGILY
ncbi:HDOD domain-containing protein [Alkalimonas amylolytica]|uniref:HD-like signal output (HDOD) domain, no enzymatic activity n=1 Tax=Alkalimonas amylolytica TaxID=152573 RepID=A0A1H3Z580_ALKAM|nr:HDOD domain-containing protein [Alkalimonas amylolytica]SEA18855.1 HD-like signal output (HDOD) domain, no enzymatic activity [Alkalimonas amylolytica]